MFLPRMLLFGVLLSRLPCAATAQAIWNPTTDFSTGNGNPNGVWGYGWMDTGFATFTPYTSSNSYQWLGWNGDGTPTIWLNTGTGAPYNVPPGNISLHPGPGTEPSVLRWTAPADFNGLTVRGQFLPGDSGTMLVAIFRNAKSNTLERDGLRLIRPFGQRVRGRHAQLRRLWQLFFRQHAAPAFDQRGARAGGHRTTARCDGSRRRGARSRLPASPCAQ